MTDIKRENDQVEEGQWQVQTRKKSTNRKQLDTLVLRRKTCPRTTPNQIA